MQSGQCLNLDGIQHSHLPHRSVGDNAIFGIWGRITHALQGEASRQLLEFGMLAAITKAGRDV